MSAFPTFPRYEDGSPSRDEVQAMHDLLHKVAEEHDSVLPTSAMSLRAILAVEVLG